MWIIGTLLYPRMLTTGINHMPKQQPSTKTVVFVPCQKCQTVCEKMTRRNKLFWVWSVLNGVLLISALVLYDAGSESRC